MVLKNSQCDLWVRNVQLSLFSLLPAIVPVIWSSSPDPIANPSWFPWHLFKNFGAWAWATVLVQVFGGLVTAVVIKYSDNIMKGFATSLSIVISFLASVALFNFSLTVPFVVGSAVVLGATWMYNQPTPTPKADVVAPEALSLQGLKNRIRPGSNEAIIAPLSVGKRSSSSLSGLVGSLKDFVASSTSNSPTEGSHPLYPSSSTGQGVNGAPLYRSQSSASSTVPPSRNPSSAGLASGTNSEGGALGVPKLS